MSLQEVRKMLEEDSREAFCPNLAGALSRAGCVEEEVYLRFGELPEGGRSSIDPGVSVCYDLYGGGGSTTFGSSPKLFEPGISCFGGRLTRQGHFVAKTHNIKLRGELYMCVLTDRPAFFLRGRMVGLGSVGEPLLDGRSVRVEPVPGEAIIAVEPMSSVLEYYDARRSGMFPDKHPDYLALLEAGARGEGVRPKVEE